MNESSAIDPSSDFLGHMLRNQRAIRNYIYSLHPHSQDLDDLVQQTAMTLWREFGNGMLLLGGHRCCSRRR